MSVVFTLCVPAGDNITHCCIRVWGGYYEIPLCTMMLVMWDPRPITNVCLSATSPTFTHTHRNEVRWCHKHLCCVSSSTSCCTMCVTVCISHPLRAYACGWLGVLMRLPSGHGWSPQRVARLGDWRSCLHCSSVSSEEEQTPFRL